MQSSSVKSYVSAIKRTLLNEKYPWQDGRILIGSLAKACKLKNNHVHTRLPIHCSLLELILFEVQRKYVSNNQPYLEKLYEVIFALGYYGLMRVGELTLSPHVVKAKDIHLAKNKDKVLIVLHSSKTHTKADRPQKIRITSNAREKSGSYIHRHFCPFHLLRLYIMARRPLEAKSEPFFIYNDGIPVTTEKARSVLHDMLKNMGLDHSLYNMHSLRIGRASDLIKYNYSIDEIKIMGRWRSNTIYKYIRN